VVEEGVLRPSQHPGSIDAGILRPASRSSSSGLGLHNLADCVVSQVDVVGDDIPVFARGF
jgi:hypothetical protein